MLLDNAGYLYRFAFLGLDSLSRRRPIVISEDVLNPAKKRSSSRLDCAGSDSNQVFIGGSRRPLNAVYLENGDRLSGHHFYKNEQLDRIT